MNLMRAFAHMLAGVTSADASARQVTGILTWREYVLEAVRCGEGFDGADPAVTVAGSGTHAGWRASAEAILDALLAMASAADAAHAAAMAAAAALEAEAMDADAEAASAEAQATSLAAQAAAYAAADEPQAAAACEAEAAGCRQAAAAARAHAQECREGAGAARALAAKAMRWAIAAREAHTVGVRLVEGEDAVALPVGEALAAAGGAREVYGTKRALVAARGGAR